MNAIIAILGLLFCGGFVWFAGFRSGENRAKRKSEDNLVNQLQNIKKDENKRTSDSIDDVRNRLCEQARDK